MNPKNIQPNGTISDVHTDSIPVSKESLDSSPMFPADASQRPVPVNPSQTKPTVAVVTKPRKTKRSNWLAICLSLVVFIILLLAAFYAFRQTT